MTTLVNIGTALSIALAVHAVINGILLRRPVAAGAVTERVAVLIPCRNEATNVVALLDSLRAQQHLHQFSIVLLDDGSTDRTYELALQAAADDSRIRVLRGVELPSGWLGKPHACTQLAAAVPDADVLIFIDADVRLQPDAIACAVRTMRALNLDLVSPYPQQVAASWSERLTQPLLQWSWLATLPLRIAEKSTLRSMSAANGQFIVIDASVYRSTGGHEAIRSEVLDDIRLLQHVKSRGYRGVVIDGSSLATCRMYSSWPEVRAGYSKWLWSAFGSPLGAALVAAFLALVYLVPVGAALTGSTVGVIGYVAGVLSRLVSAVRSGDRMRYALLHPLSIALLIVLIALSWIGRLRGSLAWKERALA